MVPNISHCPVLSCHFVVGVSWELVGVCGRKEFACEFEVRGNAVFGGEGSSKRLGGLKVAGLGLLRILAMLT